LQLYELRFAVGSPVGRAEEHDHGTLGAQQRLQRAGLAVLIAKGEGGQARPDLWPDALDVDRCPSAGLMLAGPADAYREQREDKSEDASGAA
jgi:hypothetical protein